jgi:hypothetical protein
MLDREKIVAVLTRRFPGAGTGQVAAAANAIVGLEDEWEEVPSTFRTMCTTGCYLRDATEQGARFKIFRRVPSD